MDNSLGINSDKLEKLEKKLVEEKINFLDEYCTFNCDKYDSEYLLRLNKFLFGDLYSNLGFRLKNYNGIIDSTLYNISEEVLGDKNIDFIFDNLQILWDFQPFEIGNTRTFVAFIKIINESFNLGLDIDLKTDLYSGMNLKDIINKNKSHK